MNLPAVDAPPARLSSVDRLLPVWILAAMGVGLLLARFVPAVGDALHSLQVGSVSLPIAVGLLVMMYPVLAKVRYSDARAVASDRRLLLSSLILNWVVGPAVMFTLAWVFLPDLPEYRTGLVIVGLARCIAMVLIWNELACGDREAAAFLVAINSVFQVLAFSALGWFYLQILPAWLGLSTTSASFSIWAITLSVMIFLGIPLVAGYLSRRIAEATRGRDWYENRFLPKVGPFALYGLLFTIVALFTLQGQQVIDRPLDVVRIAVPLLVYFAVIFTAGFVTGKLVGLSYERTTTLAFTAAGNNFELAIAVAIGTFGATSGQALAGIVGPLIEVPALVALVYVALWLRPRVFPSPGGGKTAKSQLLPPASPDRTISDFV
jgi:ACR3 family arsenite transporter